MMENVDVKAELSSDREVKLLKAFPIKQLKHNNDESSFLVLGCPALLRPVINFDCTVNFSFRDFDDSLNVCTGPPTFESFKLNAFEISFIDYVQPLRIVSFNEAWASDKFGAVAGATFELPAWNRFKTLLIFWSPPSEVEHLIIPTNYAFRYGPHFKYRWFAF